MHRLWPNCNLVNCYLRRVLNTLRIAIVSNAAYTYMVTDFLNLLALLKPTWCVFSQAPLNLRYKSESLFILRAMFVSKTSTCSR